MWEFHIVVKRKIRIIFCNWEKSPPAPKYYYILTDIFSNSQKKETPLDIVIQQHAKWCRRTQAQVEQMSENKKVENKDKIKRSKKTGDEQRPIVRLLVTR